MSRNVHQVCPVHSSLLQAWKCALGERKVIYLSGPITTGRLLIERIRTGNLISNAEILQKNSILLIEHANKLRDQLSDVIIEPASLNVPQWTQYDYIELWKECIGKFAHTVRFMPDWQYSMGCLEEYRFAYKMGIKTETIDGTAIVPKAVYELLRRTLDEIGLVDARELVKIREALEVTILAIEPEIRE